MFADSKLVVAQALNSRERLSLFLEVWVPFRYIVGSSCLLYGMVAFLLGLPAVSELSGSF